MKNVNYFTISGWMINELHLKGNELMLFAIIYGFSQDGESYFTGSLKYLMTALHVKSKTTVIKILKGLVNKGFLEKHRHTVNNVHFNRYTINERVVQKVNVFFACKAHCHRQSRQF